MKRILQYALAGVLALMIALAGCTDAAPVDGPVVTAIPDALMSTEATAERPRQGTPEAAPGATATAQPDAELKPVVTPTDDGLLSMLDSGNSSEGGTELMREFLAKELHQGSATPGVDKRIHDSDLVVRARFSSETADSLTFTAVEYLKGSGPDSLTIAVSTAGRSTTWDQREAILFLRASSGAGASGASGQSGQYAFTESTPAYYQGDLPVGFALGSRTAAWLPSSQTGGSGRSTDGQNYIADTSTPLGQPNPEVSHEDIRSAVAWQQADGTEGYAFCVERSIHYNQWHRDYQAYYGNEWVTWELDVELPSGVARGQPIQQHPFRHGGSLYNKSWVSGPDADYFEGKVVDQDELPSTGYSDSVETTRPLPADTYRVTAHGQIRWYQPCGFIPTEHKLNYSVEVAAPDNVLHETTFDPVALQDGVGVSADQGSTSHPGFTLDGSSVSIDGLKWDNGSVVLTLSPHASLAGQKLDFIDLEGSISLSLPASSATEDSAVGTLTWSTSDQPWEDGDLLMLRISPSTTTPQPSSSVSVVLTPRTESYGTVTNVTVAWSDPDNCDFEYRVGLYDGQDNLSRDFGRHPAPSTTTVTVETSLPWDAMPNSDLVARVSCEHLFAPDLRLVGEAELRSGLP